MQGLRAGFDPTCSGIFFSPKSLELKIGALPRALVRGWPLGTQR